MLPSFLGICHVGGGGGCPAAGTILRWDNVIYPVAEGGAYVYLYSDGDWFNDDIQYPTQTCDVAIKADGSCGEYTDWATVTNVQYIAADTLIEVSAVTPDLTNPTVEINCTDLTNVVTGYGYYNIKAFHNGYGSFYINSNFPVYSPYGTLAGSQTINGPGCDPDNPIYVTVYWDGVGGYYYE